MPRITRLPAHTHGALPFPARGLPYTALCLCKACKRTCHNSLEMRNETRRTPRAWGWSGSGWTPACGRATLQHHRQTNGTGNSPPALLQIETKRRALLVCCPSNTSASVPTAPSGPPSTYPDPTGGVPSPQCRQPNALRR